MYTPKLRRKLMSGRALDNMGTSSSCIKRPLNFVLKKSKKNLYGQRN